MQGCKIRLAQGNEDLVVLVQIWSTSDVCGSLHDPFTITVPGMLSFWANHTRRWKR